MKASQEKTIAFHSSATHSTGVDEGGIRLQVHLARLGFGSRREIEKWIHHGYVHVNGKPAKLGQKVVPHEVEIKIKGKLVQTSSRLAPPTILVLHKPRGVLTTVKDPENRPTVMDLIPKQTRVFPVGRLDCNSEGLLLLTNDGELANRLTHPRYEVPKVYQVKIRGSLDAKKIEFLKKGVTIDGEKVKGAEILNVREVTQEGVAKYEVELKVFEGKNHHVRKMFEAIRCRVIRLKRTSMGSISLKGIPHGGFKMLSPAQVKKIKLEVGLS